MEKKKASLIIILVLIMILIIFKYSHSKDFCSNIGIACSAKDYSQEKDYGYITIMLDNKQSTYATKKIKLEDQALQTQLSEIDLSNIIGINMILTLPEATIKEAHLDIRKTNVSDLLYSTDSYDKYLVVTGISLK